MQRTLLISLILSLGVWINSCQGIKETSKKHSPAGVVTYESGNQIIRVSYSRPYKKGRLIFGEKSAGALVPYGKKWRTGANEATEISFTQAITLNAIVVPAGTYSLYTIPGPDKWIIALNSRTDYWGATIPGTPFKSGKDVLRVTVPVSHQQEIQEQLTISLQEESEEPGTASTHQVVELVIAWDNKEARMAMVL